MTRRYQFSLRSLLTLLFISSFAIGTITYAFHISQVNHAAITDLKRYSTLQVEFTHNPPAFLPFLEADEFKVVEGISLDYAVPIEPFTLAIRKMKFLKRIRLTDNNRTNNIVITDGHLHCLAGLSQLESLDISDADITDDGLMAFRKYGNSTVKDLCLASCPHLTDSCLKEIVHFHELEHLALVNLLIDDESLQQLKQLKKIQIIELIYCDLSEVAVSDLQSHYGERAEVIWRDH